VPESRRLLPRLAVFAALVAALALAGCGRKGPLDPPPASLTDQHPAGAEKPAAPATQGAIKHNPLDVLLN
jgi:predicted small lipoprotein YifL